MMSDAIWMLPFDPNKPVRTKKGAKFWGEVVSLYSVQPVSETDDGRRADVRAIDPGFEGTIHVYPVAQLEQAPSGDHRLIDDGEAYALSADAMSTLMAYGLLASTSDGSFRLAHADELMADPGSAGVNHNHPKAVLAIVRAALSAAIRKDV